MFTSLSVFSQIEKSGNSISLSENKSEEKIFPKPEDYKGDFQVQLLSNEKLALTTEFLNFIEANRKDNERVELSLSMGRTLVIAGRNELDSIGSGPFKEMFIIKD